MLRTVYFRPNKPLQTDLQPDSVPKAFRDRRGVFWIDFSGEPPETSQPILESFGFHPLAIEDCRVELALTGEGQVRIDCTVALPKRQLRQST